MRLYVVDPGMRIQVSRGIDSSAACWDSGSVRMIMIVSDRDPVTWPLPKVRDCSSLRLSRRSVPMMSVLIASAPPMGLTPRVSIWNAACSAGTSGGGTVVTPGR